MLAVRLLVTLSLLWLARGVSLRESVVRSAFASFQSRFGREYATAEEASYRLEVFRGTLGLIARHNAGSHGWRMGVNRFSDLTSAEFSSRFVARPVVATTSSASGHESTGSSNPPSAQDWVSKGVVNDVQDMGKCEGAGYAFAGVGAVESAYAIFSGQHLNLSRQQVVDCADIWGGAGCQDGAYFSVYAYAQYNGLCNGTDYPYTGVKGSCQSCATAKKIRNQKNCQSISQSNLTSALAQQPVTTQLNAETFRHYKSGIFPGPCEGEANMVVLMVGYGEEGGVPFYRIQGSWGREWGEDGYVRISRGESGLGICQVTQFCAYPEV